MFLKGSHANILLLGHVLRKSGFFSRSAVLTCLVCDQTKSVLKLFPLNYNVYCIVYWNIVLIWSISDKMMTRNGSCLSNSIINNILLNIKIMMYASNKITTLRVNYKKCYEHFLQKQQKPFQYSPFVPDMYKLISSTLWNCHQLYDF